MYSEHISESLIFHLRNTALLSFESDSYYQDIISPFTRIYLINEGKGSLIIGNQKIPLEAGNLYLIPSFTSCTYHFGAGLSHYYIHLSIDQPNGLSPYSLYSIVKQTSLTAYYFSEWCKSILNWSYPIITQMYIKLNYGWIRKLISNQSVCIWKLSGFWNNFFPDSWRADKAKR